MKSSCFFLQLLEFEFEFEFEVEEDRTAPPAEEEDGTAPPAEEFTFCAKESINEKKPKNPRPVYAIMYTQIKLLRHHKRLPTFSLALRAAAVDGGGGLTFVGKPTASPPTRAARCFDESNTRRFCCTLVQILACLS